MRITVCLLFAAAVAAADTPKPQPAYSAIRVVTFEGKTTHTQIYSDSIREKTLDEDGKSGSYTDESLHTAWQ